MSATWRGAVGGGVTRVGWIEIGKESGARSDGSGSEEKGVSE